MLAALTANISMLADQFLGLSGLTHKVYFPLM